MLKENKKCKVHPAKVNKGFKKCARIEVEDPIFEENDIEVNSEDEDAMLCFMVIFISLDASFACWKECASCLVYVTLLARLVFFFLLVSIKSGSWFHFIWFVLPNIDVNRNSGFHSSSTLLCCSQVIQ